MSSISAIVIHYDGERYIEESLRRVRALPGVSEIIFVDDGSAHDPKGHPSLEGVTYARHETNRGPVAARNTGAKLATGDYLLFLDVDARPAPDYAAILRDAFDQDESVGVATGKMIEKGSRLWWNFGYDPQPLRDRLQGWIDDLVLRFWRIWVLRETLMRIATPFTLNFVPDKRRDVDWVIERGFMTRRALFEKLGGMDEGYVMFFEGPDYCRRARQAGYRVLYIPEAVCDHEPDGHSHDGKKRSELFVNARNRYLKKFAKGSA